MVTPAYKWDIANTAGSQANRTTSRSRAPTRSQSPGNSSGCETVQFPATHSCRCQWLSRPAALRLWHCTLYYSNFEREPVYSRNAILHGPRTVGGYTNAFCGPVRPGGYGLRITYWKPAIPRWASKHDVPASSRTAKITRQLEPSAFK